MATNKDANKSALPHPPAAPAAPPTPPPLTATDDDEEEDEEWEGEEWEGENEEDMQYSVSEQAKEEVRRQLRELKAMYRSIRQRNEEIPEQFRLKDSEFKLPDVISALHFAKIQGQCEEVYRIHEYESAETIIQLEKIQRFYFDPIETMHVVVKDISHDLQVHSLRNRKIPKEFKELDEKNRDLIEEDLRILRQQAVATESELKETVPPVVRIYAKDIIGEYESKIDTYDIDTVHNIRHLEKRLEQRYYREVAWQELMQQKIEPDYIPPEDQDALERAKNESGVFQLQNSESYLGENITIPERRQRIIDMKFFVREQTKEFNTMLLAARDEKPKIIQECRRLEREIRKIHVLLPEEFRRKIPTIYDLEPEEMPETIMDIRQEDVDAEENILLTNAGLQGVREEINEDYFGHKKPEKPLFGEDEDAPAIPPAARAGRQAKAVDLEYESVASHRCRKCQAAGQSDIEKKTFEVQFYPVLYKQEMLFKDLMRVIDYFHQRVKHLYDIRLRLDLDVKIKSISLLTMIGELDIAKEFDAQEKGILERLRAQQAECKNAKKQMENIKKRLVKVNADMKICETNILGIAKEVEVVIGGKSRFSEYLWRVFKKKIKIEIEEGTEEDEEGTEIRRNLESSTESTDSSASTSQDSGSDLFKLPKQKMDINICPEHLDKTLYQKVIDLRQKKAAIELEMDTNKRLGERQSAEYIDMEKVYLKYEGGLTEISEEIRVLQRRRQKRMNDLQLMVIMRADQIECMDLDEAATIEGTILDKLAHGFPDAGSVIIFPKGETGGLTTRSQELTKKAKDEKIRYKQGKRMIVRLRQELKKAEKEVEKLKAQCKTDMVEKFGKIVDLDKICAVIINLELLDQDIFLDKLKKKQYRERERVNEEIEDTKYMLTKKIEDNSQHNMSKAGMLKRRRDLEYYHWKADMKSKEIKSTTTGITLNEAGGSGDASQASLITILSVTAQSEASRLGRIEKEIDDSRNLLHKQQERILQLKAVLQKCRTKSGLPPLVPLTQTPQGPGLGPTCTGGADPKQCTFTKTSAEMPTMNQFCDERKIQQCKVRTVYKKPDTGETLESQRGSFTQLDVQNALTDAEEHFDAMNFDYSSGEEEDAPQGGEAAVRGLQETIDQLLPDEQEEFLQYLEEQAGLDVDEAEEEQQQEEADDEATEEEHEQNVRHSLKDPAKQQEKPVVESENKTPTPP